MTPNINGAVEVNHQDAMLLARKAHEAMMKEGRGMHLWGAGTPVREVQEFCARLAALVASAEREACAQLVERNADVCGSNTMLCDVLRGNAAAIRARGE